MEGDLAVRFELRTNAGARNDGELLRFPAIDSLDTSASTDVAPTDTVSAAGIVAVGLVSTNVGTGTGGSLLGD